MSFDVPPPHSELRRLEPLVGSWRAEEETEYDTRFGDEPAQKGINYWGYDSDEARYRIVFFSNNGPFSEEGNQYFGRLDDGGLVFEGPARFRYGLGEDGRVAVNPDGTISVDWWLRDERGDWRPWMGNTFEKS